MRTRARCVYFGGESKAGMVRRLRQEEIYDILSALDRLGWAIIPDFLEREEASALLAFGEEEEEYQDIFQEVGDEAPNDGSRAQRFVTGDRELRLLQGRLERECQRLFPHWRLRDFVTFLSRPGGANQEFHTDYPVSQCLEADAYPAGALLALQEGTRLLVPGQVISVPLHGCLLFKGSCLHAGSAYSLRHVRGHFLLDVEGVRYEADSVGVVSLGEVLCVYCRAVFSRRAALRYHAERCPNEDNPGRGRRRARMRRRVDCPVCWLTMSRGSLLRHLRQFHPEYHQEEE